MIPVDARRIVHTWPALDDFDDDISDRVNDDLIPYDDDDYDDQDTDESSEYPRYDDPSLLLADSLSSASTVDDSENRNRNDRYKSHRNDDSDSSGNSTNSDIDEDEIILALDDSTNRRRQRQQVVARARNIVANSKNHNRRTTSNPNDNNVVTVRVKKSVKYGHLANRENDENNNRENDTAMVPSKPQKNSDRYSNHNSNSDKYSRRSEYENDDNTITVRVKKSVKYGKDYKTTTKRIADTASSNSLLLEASEKALVRASSAMVPVASAMVPCEPHEETKPSRIGTIRSDGTIRYETTQESSKVLAAAKPKPTTVATIKSDGRISYRPVDSKSLVPKQPQTIATIQSDGCITYSLGGDDKKASSSSKAVVPAGPPRVATINSEGFITYSSPVSSTRTGGDEIAKENSCIVGGSYTVQKSLLSQKRNVTFRNIVTDSERDRYDPEDDDDDMDDDICDKLDDSRHTRSLHSMPVLEEVTEEESPLHAAHGNLLISPMESKSSVASSEIISPPNSSVASSEAVVSPATYVGDVSEDEPTWLELRRSPSATAAMTPRRTNDDQDYEDDDFGDPHRNASPRWYQKGVLGACSHAFSTKNGALYKSMAATPLKKSHKKKSNKPPREIYSHEPPMVLHVETVSTGSVAHSASDGGSVTDLGSVSAHSRATDLEAGGGRRRGNNRKVFRGDSTAAEEKSHDSNASKQCCGLCGRAAAIWIAVLVAIAMAVTAYLLLVRYLPDRAAISQDRSEGQLEGWTQDESPFEDYLEEIGFDASDASLPSSGTSNDSVFDDFEFAGGNTDPDPEPTTSNDVVEAIDTETIPGTVENSNDFDLPPPEDETSNDFDFPEDAVWADRDDTPSLAPSDVPTGFRHGFFEAQTSGPTNEDDKDPAMAFAQISLTPAPVNAVPAASLPAAEPTAPPTAGSVPSVAVPDTPVPVPVSLPTPAVSLTSPTAAANAVPTAAPVPVAIEASLEGDPILVVRDTAAINEVIFRARREIEQLIFGDDDFIGKFLRLVFHDCVGGCDGCVDMTDPENAGLIKPIEALQPIAESFAAEGLTRTDVWMMSGLVASKLALPFESSDLQFPLHWIGRQTCETRFPTDPATGSCGLDFHGNPTPCTATRGPAVKQPHGTFGTTSVLDFFRDEFGFDAQQVTAIMGAHSVGKMARENVGNMGQWDLTTTTLDGGYWLELVGNPPDFFLEVIDNADLPNIPNRFQWRGIIPVGTTQRSVAMLNVDAALVRNVQDMDDNGSVGCAGRGTALQQCSNETPFLPFAKQYNANNRQFLMDFREVLNIMIDHGNPKPSPKTKCPEGLVCAFGSNGSLEVVERLVTDPPTMAPSRAPPKSFPVAAEGQPRVFLDKVCYGSVGDTLVVSWDGVVDATDITFFVFALDDVAILDDGRLSLDPVAAANPLESTLSCDREKCHSWTARGGVQVPTTNLAGGDYALLMFAKTAEGGDDLRLLGGDSFRLEDC